MKQATQTTLTFLLSAAVGLGAAITALKLTGGAQPLLRAFLLAALFITSFTALAAFLKLPYRATLAGLLTGSALFMIFIIFFDWALGSPPTEQLTLESFLAYTRLYRNSTSPSALLLPSLVTLLSFFAGRGVAALFMFGKTKPKL